MIGVTREELEAAVVSIEEQLKKAYRQVHTTEGALALVRGQLEAVKQKEADLEKQLLQRSADAAIPHNNS